jgi:hypothetical protein
MANALEQAQVDPGTNEERKRIAQQQRAERERHRQALNLQRENILSQRTSNPNRRAALEAALSQIESQLSAIG